MKNVFWCSAALFARGWKKSRFHEVANLQEQGYVSLPSKGKGMPKRAAQREWLEGFLSAYVAECGTPGTCRIVDVCVSHVHIVRSTSTFHLLWCVE